MIILMILMILMIASMTTFQGGCHAAVHVHKEAGESPVQVWLVILVQSYEFLGFESS